MLPGKNPFFIELLAEKSGLGYFELKTVAKLGVSPLRPPCQQMRNISPRPCPDPLGFLVFNTETADKPIWHAKSHHVAF